MEKLIALIEKGKPFFNAIARNKYLKAIRDGFISVMPIIIVSSIFLLAVSYTHLSPSPASPTATWGPRAC